MDNRPLVLVADRQPESTRLVALSLGEEGFRVEAAHDGLSALDKVSELNPDLLLLGVDLPDPSASSCWRSCGQPSTARHPRRPAVSGVGRVRRP